MWKDINIDGKLYVYGCGKSEDITEFSLYNCDECWRHTQSAEEMVQLVKKLNKRIQFDAATITDTLQNAQPEQVDWAELDIDAAGGDGGVEKQVRVLKVKYRAGGKPLHYELQMKRLTTAETVTLPANEVLNVVESLPAQVEELLDVLRRKEEEIAQYKREHGNLKRSTLATKPFDVQQFHERFVEANTKAKCLSQMLDRRKARSAESSTANAVPSISPSKSNIPKAKLEDTNEQSPTSSHNSIKESPRSRKRKAKLEQKLQLARKLIAGTHTVEYENSQSQSPVGSQELASNYKASNSGIDNTILPQELASNNKASNSGIDDTILPHESSNDVNMLEVERVRKSPRLLLRSGTQEITNCKEVAETTKKRRTAIEAIKNVKETVEAPNSQKIVSANPKVRESIRHKAKNLSTKPRANKLNNTEMIWVDSNRNDIHEAETKNTSTKQKTNESRFAIENTEIMRVGSLTPTDNHVETTHVVKSNTERMRKTDNDRAGFNRKKTYKSCTQQETNKPSIMTNKMETIDVNSITPSSSKTLNTNFSIGNTKVMLKSASNKVINKTEVTTAKPKSSELSLYVDSVLKEMEAVDRRLQDDFWDGL